MDATTQASPHRIGLALAGGGPEGAVYEIGALRAVHQAIDGLDLTDLQIYVGVSAGAYVSACLANRITPDHMCAALANPGPGHHPFRPEVFFMPAVGELVRGGLRIPALVADGLVDLLYGNEGPTLFGSFGRLTRALPVGLFQNEPIRKHLAHLFSLGGRTDDFRRLERRLVVVAADLDSGEAVRFGDTGRKDVAISRAVQASTALPGLYPPVTIDGRHYVDGVLLKTLHASVALESDIDLLLCINPIVPVDTVGAVEAGAMRRGKLVNRGLPTVMSQAFRTLIYSRLQTGMAAYEPRFPDQDILLLEPGRDDYRMFFTNVFRFSSRRAVCDHAFRATRQQLRERREELEPMLARHGLRLRHDFLDDDVSGPWDGLDVAKPRPRKHAEAPAAERLGALLDRLDAALERDA